MNRGSVLALTFCVSPDVIQAEHAGDVDPHKRQGGGGRETLVFCEDIDHRRELAVGRSSTTYRHRDGGAPGVRAVAVLLCV